MNPRSKKREAIMQQEEVQDFIWKCKAGYPVTDAEVKRIAEWLGANWDKVRRFAR